MARDQNRFEAELSAADTHLIKEMTAHTQPPPLSESMLRSLRTGRPRTQAPKPRFRSSSIPWAATALAASLGLFVLLSPRTQPAPQALSFGVEGGWNYELFAPPEFDPFSRIYDNEMLLPVEYAALEHWVD